MGRAVRRSLVLVTLLAAAPRAAAGQQAACPWDRCALRMHYGFFGTRIVAGEPPATVARFGLFAPRVDVLAAAGDSVRLDYEAFRDGHNTGALLTLVGAGMSVAGIALWDPFDAGRNEAGLGLMIGGAGLGLAGGLVTVSARNRLERAVWRYNRGLSR